MANKTFSKIERSKFDEHPIHGVVIQESNNLIMLHREVDFVFDGIVVVQKKDISKHTTGTIRQRRYEKIMRAEGLWKSPGRLVNRLPIGDWKELLEATSGKPVLIENERISSSWIGIVENCSEKQVTIRCFDSLGAYEDEAIRIPYRVITAIQFGDRYTQLQFKYIGQLN